MNADKRHRGRRGGGPARAHERGRADGRYWLFGRHAVTAACANPVRTIHRLLAVDPAPWRQTMPDVVTASREEIADLLQPGVVHQGIAALVDPLPALALEEVCQPQPGAGNLLIALDQIEDAQNVGAILRSAAAFGVRAILMPERHSPAESGLMARAAVGMLEQVPLVRVVNLVRALEQLAELGYWRYGLDAESPSALHRTDWADNVVLVVGAEGRGLRRLTAEACDGLLSIAMAPGVESLNVSVATAIALHEIYRLKH